MAQNCGQGGLLIPPLSTASWVYNLHTYNTHKLQASQSGWADLKICGHQGPAASWERGRLITQRARLPRHGKERMKAGRHSDSSSSSPTQILRPGSALPLSLQLICQGLGNNWEMGGREQRERRKACCCGYWEGAPAGLKPAEVTWANIPWL